jgi:hypothetical protein
MPGVTGGYWRRGWMRVDAFRRGEVARGQGEYVFRRIMHRMLERVQNNSSGSLQRIWEGNCRLEETRTNIVNETI